MQFTEARIKNDKLSFKGTSSGVKTKMSRLCTLLCLLKDPEFFLR